MGLSPSRGMRSCLKCDGGTRRRWRIAVSVGDWPWPGCWWRSGSLGRCWRRLRRSRSRGPFNPMTGSTTPGFIAIAPGADAGVDGGTIGHPAGPRRDVLRPARTVGAAGSDFDHRRRGECTKDRRQARESPLRSRSARRKPPFYGTLEIPTEQEAIWAARWADARPGHRSIGPPEPRPAREDYEIPQARADILTASLRGNPIFYADSQLVPYGSDSVRRPDGPTSTT